MLFDHKQAWVDAKIYEEIYENSIRYPDDFWKYHSKNIYWKQEPKEVFDRKTNQWLTGGISNVCYNCVDRHVLKTPKKPAIIWYGDTKADRREITYSELFEMIAKIASILRSNGIEKGDVVGVYMPMIPEAIATMLACSRIGAIHLVTFAGFSSEALEYRLSEMQAKVLLTISSFSRGGKSIDLIGKATKAISNIKNQIKLINLDTIDDNNPTNESKLEWYASDTSLFTLYTSGSAGNPKAITHSAMPYLLYTSTTFKMIFGIQENDVYFCTSDIGWITGHSYIVYAPLFHGITTVIFSGSPTYPEADRYWEIIEREHVSIFYTAPTAIRSLKMFNKKLVEKHDLSSLKVLGSVGEPINKSAWEWFFNIVGKQKCPIMDTWWQTETGGIILAPLRTLDQKPGIAGKPFFGVKTNIIDGELIIENKWPGLCKEKTANEIFKTGDGASYKESYGIKIAGRIDDVINISGHRLGTAEFECAINKVEDVKESAVVAVPDEIKGQTAFAYVVLNSTNNQISDIVKKIINATRDMIGSIAKPDFIAIVPDLPRTRSGKIVRKLLRDIANNKENLSELSSIINTDSIPLVKKAVQNAIFCPDMCKL